MRTTTLNQLHSLLSACFAVCVNDTLYFVGYDMDGIPYVADNDGNDKIEFSEVNGDIEILENNGEDYGVFLYVGEEPLEIKFLTLANLDSLI